MLKKRTNAFAFCILLTFASISVASAKAQIFVCSPENRLQSVQKLEVSCHFFLFALSGILAFLCFFNNLPFLPSVIAFFVHQIEQKLSNWALFTSSWKFQIYTIRIGSHAMQESGQRILHRFSHFYSSNTWMNWIMLCYLLKNWQKEIWKTKVTKKLKVKK